MKMNVRNICLAIIIIICIFVLSYVIYSAIFRDNSISEVPNIPRVTEDIAFDDLFDNQVHLQEYSTANFVNKIEQTKDIVYTAYTLNEVYEGKYDIQASIPCINVNNTNIIDINKEIISIFYDKLDSIIEASKEEEVEKAVYAVSYTAYLNENMLSLVIRATLKEGDNAQRLIIKGYNYNLSTNEEISLKEILEIKGISISEIESKIKDTVQEAINYSENLSYLGYETYKRDIENEMYEVENSNNYILGPNESIYIIYAYGNTSFTTESDIVYVK